MRYLLYFVLLKFTVIDSRAHRATRPKHASVRVVLTYKYGGFAAAAMTKNGGIIGTTTRRKPSHVSVVISQN